MTQKEFETLYDSYAASVVRFLAYYTKNRSQLEDWVQLVFLRVWNYREAVDIEGDYLKTYLLKIARNVAITELAKERKTKLLYQPDMSEFAAGDREEEPVNSDLLFEKYHTVLHKIPVRSLQVYKLNREEGLTYQEIAETLQISPRTVEVHIRKALRILRQELKEFQH